VHLGPALPGGCPSTGNPGSWFLSPAAVVLLTWSCAGDASPAGGWPGLLRPGRSACAGCRGFQASRSGGRPATAAAVSASAGSRQRVPPGQAQTATRIRFSTRPTVVTSAKPNAITAHALKGTRPRGPHGRGRHKPPPWGPPASLPPRHAPRAASGPACSRRTPADGGPRPGGWAGARTGKRPFINRSARPARHVTHDRQARARPAAMWWPAAWQVSPG
jgi:hypothetical protein